MDYVNNVIGDLEQKLFMNEVEEPKPVRRKQASDKPKAPKKASQWEIREELAKKKREQIMDAVLRKREKEEELKALADKKKKQEAQLKEKERDERVKKRELERKKMLADRKKAKAKQKGKFEFEFIGTGDGEQDDDNNHNDDQDLDAEGQDDKEEQKVDNSKGQAYSHCQIYEGPYKIKDEDAVNLIEK
jgi:hypothetical protein